MSFNVIGVDGAVSLASSKNCANIIHLNLESNMIREEGIYAIVMSENLANLEHLDLKSNGIGNSGIQSISIGLIKKLKFLNVQHNNISDDGYRIISESMNFQQLKDLKIYDGNQASTEAKNAIKRSNNLQALRFIN